MVDSSTPRILYRTFRVANWLGYSARPPYDEWLRVHGVDHNPIVRYEYLSSGNGKTRVNPCEHILITQDSTTAYVELSESTAGPPGDYSAIIGSTYFPKDDLESVCIPFIRPFSVDWDSVVQNVIPSLRSEFNLLNFAAEFGDLRSIFDSVRNALRSPASALPFRRRIRGGRVGTYMDWQSLSDSYLGLTFGVQPLIGDIQAIWDRYQNYGETIGRIRARLTRGVRASQQRFYTLRVTKPFVLQATTFRFNATVTFTGTVTEVASCKVRGSLPSQPIREYLDYIGFYPDLSTLWNALPFTFVADYFLPFSEALDGGSWVRPEVSVSDGCYSIKVEGQWRVQVADILDGAVLKPEFESQIQNLFTSGRFKYYRRFAVDPYLDGVDLPPVSFPNARQALNIAALFTSAVSR